MLSPIGPLENRIGLREGRSRPASFPSPNDDEGIGLRLLRRGVFFEKDSETSHRGCGVPSPRRGQSTGFSNDIGFPKDTSGCASESV